MFKELQSYYQTQDRFVFWPVALSILSACLIILFWALNLTRLPKELPLFYSLAWGEPFPLTGLQLGGIFQFLVLPSVLMSIVLINAIICTQLHDSQLIIKRLLSIVSLIVSILILITAFEIILIFV